VVASETKSGLFLLEITGGVLQKMGLFAPDSVLPNQLQFFLETNHKEQTLSLQRLLANYERTALKPVDPNLPGSVAPE
jgi:hypothetical protein